MLLFAKLQGKNSIYQATKKLNLLLFFPSITPALNLLICVSKTSCEQNIEKHSEKIIL